MLKISDLGSWLNAHEYDPRREPDPGALKFILTNPTFRGISAGGGIASSALGLGNLLRTYAHVKGKSPTGTSIGGHTLALTPLLAGNAIGAYLAHRAYKNLYGQQPM